MKKINCRCKFCSKEIEMNVDVRGFDNPLLDLKRWLNHIACNRCASYYEAKNRLTDAIGTACNLLINSRRDAKVLTVIETKLTTITKNLCKLICDFKLIQFVWDAEFVNMLMDKPEQFSKVINLYTSGLNKIISKAESLPYKD